MQKIRLLLGVLIVSTVITGCEGQKIFREKVDKYALPEVTKENLEEDIYYVKNGTRFSPVYAAENTKAFGNPNTIEESRICYFLKEESMVPEYFSNEYLAVSGSSLQLRNVSLERYKDLGYSFGLYGCTVDEDGYLCFDLKQNIVINSDIDQILATAKSNEIRITTINGEPVSDKNINSAGVITGLEKEKEYTLSFYSGTYYGTVSVVADTHMIQSFEWYELTEIETTKNGYLKITLPDDLKSGWYCIEGQGIFKYYDFAKGASDGTKIDLNEEYYQSEEEREAVYTQQYVLSVAEKTRNVSVIMNYDTSGYEKDEIRIRLKSPDGNVMEMKPEKGSAKVDLAVAMAGKWTVSVIPKELEIIDLKVESNPLLSDTIVETKEFKWTDDSENVEFAVLYSGEGEVWGTVENENGESKDLREDENGRLYYCYSYLPAGTYTVTIYHDTDTKIDEITSREDAVETTTDIITVVE